MLAKRGSCSGLILTDKCDCLAQSFTAEPATDEQTKLAHTQEPLVELRELETHRRLLAWCR